MASLSPVEDRLPSEENVPRDKPTVVVATAVTEAELELDDADDVAATAACEAVVASVADDTRKDWLGAPEEVAGWNAAWVGGGEMVTIGEVGTETAELWA